MLVTTILVVVTVLPVVLFIAEEAMILIDNLLNKTN